MVEIMVVRRDGKGSTVAVVQPVGWFRSRVVEGVCNVNDDVSSSGNGKHE